MRVQGARGSVGPRLVVQIKKKRVTALAKRKAIVPPPFKPRLASPAYDSSELTALGPASSE